MANTSFDERTVEMMERNSERIGSINMAEASNNKSIKACINRIMKAIGADSNALYDIREDCCKTTLYFDCVMSQETRNQLLAKLAEMTGILPDSYKIVAYYN